MDGLNAPEKSIRGGGATSRREISGTHLQGQALVLYCHHSTFKPIVCQINPAAGLIYTPFINVIDR